VSQHFPGEAGIQYFFTGEHSESRIMIQRKFVRIKPAIITYRHLLIIFESLMRRMSRHIEHLRRQMVAKRNNWVNQVRKLTYW
jgi:hypothetical protein